MHENSPHAPCQLPLHRQFDLETLVRRISNLILLGIIPVAVGVGIVATPLHIIVFLGWMLFMMRYAYLHVHDQRRNVPLVLGWQIMIVAGITIAAIYAPVKTKDRILDRIVTLPSTTMTLADLDEIMEEPHDFWPATSFRQAISSLNVPPAEMERAIHWPSRRLKLREFVAAIEQQSSLRHRFSSCGNCSTILYGEDCGSGLMLRPDRSF